MKITTIMPKKNIKFIYTFLFVALSVITLAKADDFEQEKFYFDAIIFKNNVNDSARVDIFCVVPNESLNFLNFDSMYNAKYQIYITIIDSTNKNIVSKKIEKSVKTDNFLAVQGANAEFSQIQLQYFLPKGNYKVRLVLTDVFANADYEKSRNISVINFFDYPFSTSGILLLSAIEERDGKFAITPHISDNVGTLQDGYFAFFEVYNDFNENKLLDKINVVSEIIDSDSKEIVYTDTSEKICLAGTNQVYVRFPKDINYGKKSNILRITLQTQDNKQILAVAQRSIKFQSYLIDKIIMDIDVAVRQMRYVASDTEIKYIQSSSNSLQKQERFEEFWKKLDPTPQTERNEALEEYYSRVDYANRNFKSYSAGWMTDKGHVYIVYGAPNAVDRSNAGYSEPHTYEKWTYYNNRVFLFYDATGFGDFRLSNPAFVTEKYEYF